MDLAGVSEARAFLQKCLILFKAFALHYLLSHPHPPHHVREVVHLFHPYRRVKLLCLRRGVQNLHGVVQVLFVRGDERIRIFGLRFVRLGDEFDVG